MTLQSWTNTCLLTTPRTSFVGRKLIRLHNIWLVLPRWWVSYLWPASKSMKLQISPNYCEKSSKITFFFSIRGICCPQNLKRVSKYALLFAKFQLKISIFFPPFTQQCESAIFIALLIEFYLSRSPQGSSSRDAKSAIRTTAVLPMTIIEKLIYHRKWLRLTVEYTAVVIL